MVKITFYGHDYIEFAHKGKTYTVDTKADEHHEPSKWHEEVKNIQKETGEKLLKKYKGQVVDPLPKRTLNNNGVIDKIMGWK